MPAARSGIWRAALLPALLLPALPLTAGCASARAPDVEASVHRFYDAYRHHDGEAACRALAPAARRQVAGETHTSCARGLLRERLPAAGEVRSTRVFGDLAQVRLRGDTVFVARTGTHWQVRAVGCVRRRDAPYDCEVEGGG